VALFALVTFFGTGAVSAEPPAGEGWALVIGINAYERYPHLNYAVADAQAVAATLPRAGFPSKNIRILLDRDASRGRIEQVLYRDLTAMKPDDRLLVYFAGHGATHPLRDGEEGFFLPVDADPEALPATAISMQSVRQITQRLKGKQYFFVMDACFSGFALTRDREKPKPGELAEKFLEQPVIQVLTAGRRGEKAIEMGGHGIFTRRLLEGLRGAADTDRKGFVTGVELAGWIETRVLQDSDGKMTPQYGRLDGEGQFVFFFPGGPGEHLPASAPSIKAVPRTGSLLVRSPVEIFEIRLDDRRMGEVSPSADVIVNDLPEGTYRLRAVSGQGGDSSERQVRILAGQRTEIAIEASARSVAVTVGSVFEVTRDASPCFMVHVGGFSRCAERGTRLAVTRVVGSSIGLRMPDGREKEYSLGYLRSIGGFTSAR
jgi:hypothetical protein